jgi:uncharacterized protein YkwD
LRKLAAAALALPVVAFLFVPMLVRRSVTARIVLAIVLSGLLGLGAIGISRPLGIAATPPSKPVPLTSAAFRTDLRVHQSPSAAVQIAFSTAMESGSVESSLRVEPPTSIDLAWNADRTLLTVSPRFGWRTGTYHTITVAQGALAATGRPLTAPVRAVFLTRPATAGSIAPTREAGDRVGLDTAFVLAFDRPVDVATLRGALVARPALAGTLEPLGRRTESNRFVFTPAKPLASDSRYELSISGAVRDMDGAALANAATVVVRTVAAPNVVRFRPRLETIGVERTANLSVRFTQPMNRATTAKAFSVSVGGKAVAGKLSFFENDTVLAFDPASALPYDQTIMMRVASSATSATGVALANDITGTFTTAAKPSARTIRTTAPTTTTTVTPPAGAGAGTWTAVEAYYLDLMNCTRTGGIVTAGGLCSSPGGRSVAPLALDAGISAKVSRPYAKLLATRNLCSHFASGGPANRLRRAGYTSYNWAENLGCRSGNPAAAVLGSHLFFQAERASSPVGGHYRNLMNAKYDRVGIGVWVSGGRVRLVVDFYHP